LAVFIVSHVVAGELIFSIVIDASGLAVSVVLDPFARLFARVESAFAPLAAIGVVQHPRAVFFAVFVLDVFEMADHKLLHVNPARRPQRGRSSLIGKSNATGCFGTSEAGTVRLNAP